MKLKTHVITQYLEQDHMLISAVEEEGGFHGLVRSNETAGFIVECLKEDVSEADILRKLQNEYNGNEAVMRADIHAIVERLNGLGLLEGEAPRT